MKKPDIFGTFLDRMKKGREEEEREKTRIAFDLTAEALEELDNLQEKAGLNNRADLVRNSLRLYAWFIEQQKQGCEVILRDDEEEKVVELVF